MVEITPRADNSVRGKRLSIVFAAFDVAPLEELLAEIIQ
jgi:hypothetical protein